MSVCGSEREQPYDNDAYMEDDDGDGGDDDSDDDRISCSSGRYSVRSTLSRISSTSSARRRCERESVLRMQVTTTGKDGAPRAESFYLREFGSMSSRESSEDDSISYCSDADDL